MNPADYPILARLVELVREETALDVTLTLEGGRFYTGLADKRCGPMDHGQAWYHLIGLWMGAEAPKTLDTEKRRKAKRYEEAIKKAQDAQAEKAAE